MNQSTVLHLHLSEFNKMSPKPKYNETSAESIASGYRLSHPFPGDEICISGIAGMFPDSDNVIELRENLFNKVDLVSGDDRRWKLSHPEIPQRTGKINHLNRFDASFFGVQSTRAHTMDPMCRLLLEKSYEAIVDAGVNPKTLKDSKTAVIIGACFSESEKTWLYEKMQVNGYGITGCCRAILANQISYWLGCTGPSYSIDSACSSSLYAVEHAYRAIRDGHCESAIVGGCNLCLNPFISLQFSRLGVLSPEGRCKSFDKDASGYARSETVSVIFLQKAKNAKRVYAQILHAKTNCDGYKEQGITYPAGHVQKMLFSEFYKECNVSPLELEFIESHGTGTRVGDPEELIALDEIFCTGRTTPLKIGTIKSNLGHSEPASGLCSIIKMCLAYDSGYIPPNLHYENPREGVAALSDGRISVVCEKTPWNRGMVGINSFGFGGANAHVLLKSFAKPKVNGGAPKDDLPRLVCISGRTESAVNRILDDLESRKVDAEYVRLFHSIHEENISGHTFRGYTLLRPKNDIIRVCREVQYLSMMTRPIWFVFSGMGSQWAGMGSMLLRIPVFAAAIERCHQVLHPNGIDIIRIITDPNPKIYNNILHSFVGIAAIQIGLCDVLKEIGIEADHLIGHGIGELGCAYADGCLSTEQMILVAYSKGMASIETPIIKGSMATVSLGYHDMKSLCPPDIEVACHNGPDSSTISGPAESIKAFAQHLQRQGILVNVVPYCNIAYHSRYIAETGHTLLKYLHRVIPEPRKRSSKWVSTSVPEHLQMANTAQYSSADYYTNNMLSPVLFEETSKLIHKNAITIEIAPQGLLQAILRRSLNYKCINVALTKCGHHDNIEYLLQSIGQLYEVGLNPRLSNLYPKVELPVSIGTPIISHLVEWDHEEDWFVISYRGQQELKSGERTVKVTVTNENMEYLAGHVIDGRNLYPATGYLVLVWETLGMMMGELFTEVSVVFEDVRFQRATNIPKEGDLDFTITIQKKSGNFEIVESNTAIVTGKVFAKKDVFQDYRQLEEPAECTGPFVRNVSTKDFYKEMRLRGYNYSGLFRGLHSCNVDGTRGLLRWQNNWVTFMDTMMQIKIVGIDSRGLYVPTRIEKLSIDYSKHYAMISAIPDNDIKCLPVIVYNENNIIRSGGIEVRGLVASPITKRNPLGIPVLEKYDFIPNFPKNNMTVRDIVRADVQIALENVQGIKVKSIELIDSATEPGTEPLITFIRDALEDTPLLQAELLVIAEENLDLGVNVTVENKKLTGETNALLFVGSKLMERDEVLEQAFNCLKEKAFVISRENASFVVKDRYKNIAIITAMKTGTETFVLLRKKINPRPAKFIQIKESDERFIWIDEVKENMKESIKLMLFAENEKLNGILGLVNCLRREPGGEVVNCVTIMDPKAPRFDPDNPLYEAQIDKELSMNVFKDGQWGTYRHSVLEELQNFPVDHAYVNVTTRGDLSSLRWIEGDLNIHKENNVFHVYYSAMNFRDIMTATGRIPVETVARGRLNQECVQGLEFAGKTKDGLRIMGLVASKGLANVVKTDDFMYWPIPDAWTMEDAATIPICYSTVLYALMMVAHMQPGESVLIHAGTGGVGQAAINVCLYYGCKVFTTVGTPEKRAAIKMLYPQLTDDCIGNSRDTSFEEMIMFQTEGKGVDIVLNSLADDKLLASVRCLGKRGRFLEIGKVDIVNNTNVGMEFLLKDASMHGIMLDFLFDKYSDSRKELSNLIFEGLVNGSVKPICRVVFNTDEIEKCFRYMAGGKHMGKVLIKIRDEEPDKGAKPAFIKINAIPRYKCFYEDVYVVVGGLGGFGLELIDWLVMQGARKVVINSRRGLSNGYQAMRLRAWTSYGVNIKVCTDDISTREGCVNLLKTANTLGPVKAIFNLAVILKDALFENQTPETFKQSFAPKARATKFLDAESRKLCPRLTDFVIFSSVVCGRGNAGQTNYGMANSVMERICEERLKAGLPALAVEWGAIGEVGLIADLQEEHVELEIGGTLQQKISNCLRVLDQFLRHRKYPVLCSMVVAEKKAGGSGCGTIVDTVSTIMGIKDLRTISMQATLAELGMDSMMAVEIKQSLEREFEIFLTAQDIRTLSFSRLLELTAEREVGASSFADTKSSEGMTGFKILMRNLGDEIPASEPFINMSTLFNDGKEIDLEGKLDMTLFMIPGVEGMATTLESISKRLKCQATVLQLGYEHPDETIKETANRLFQIVRSRLSPGGKFTLLGYSFGVIIALEVANILEKYGYIGRIFCIDGSPDVLPKMAKVNFDTSKMNIMQDSYLCHIMDLIAPKMDKKPLYTALSAIDTWDSKIECLLKHVPESVKYSKQYQKGMAKAVFGRVLSILAYDDTVSYKLKSQVILLRTKDYPIGVVTDEQYCLQKYVQQPIQTHLLEGNHVTILENKDCANIINKCLADQEKNHF
ncbi:fatty acid synthase-like [Arctopsyche grandis]|uniref:fatty acid synthase-like n=1 Tax=Arctopsyche grandis TaxID=121162 RepID=UPI00406DA23E